MSRPRNYGSRNTRATESERPDRLHERAACVLNPPRSCLINVCVPPTTNAAGLASASFRAGATRVHHQSGRNMTSGCSTGRRERCAAPLLCTVAMHRLGRAGLHKEALCLRSAPFLTGVPREGQRARAHAQRSFGPRHVIARDTLLKQGIRHPACAVGFCHVT